MTEPSPQTIDKIPASVQAARALFYLMGAVWFLFGLITLFPNPATAWSVALLMFINAALLFFIGWGIGKQIRRYYYFGILFIAANIFLTVTDEFGLFDVITLAIDLILLVLLLFTHSYYRATD